jgi:tetratricopeptide (TPR) repeat protein
MSRLALLACCLLTAACADPRFGDQATGQDSIAPEATANEAALDQRCIDFAARDWEVELTSPAAGDSIRDPATAHYEEVIQCALEQDRPEVASELTRRATLIEPDDLWLRWLQLHFGLELDRIDDSIEAFHVLARRAPEMVRELDLGLVSRFLSALMRSDRTRASALEVHDLLQGMGYRPPAPYFDDFLRMDHARLLLAQGHVERARDRLRPVLDIESIVLMRVDRRFSALWSEPGISSKFNLAEAARRDILRSRRAMNANPELMEAVYLHALVLLTANRDVAGLRITMNALERDQADPTRFIDRDEFRPWLLDVYGSFLYNLGRIDEGRKARRAASGLDDGRINIGPAINHAMYLMLEGRAHEALELLPHLGDASPYGEALIENVRVCASAQLGDTTGAEAALRRLESRSSDGPSAYTGALICVGDIEKAAAHVVRRLESDRTREGALLMLQRGPTARAVAMPIEARIEAAREAIRRHPDVVAAARRVGRVETLPVRVGSY